ncbi:MAG: hypothetical protein ACLRSW_11740 [Christensenellaceae bacterium]
MEEEKLTAQTSTENESVQVGNAEPDEEKQVDASENVSVRVANIRQTL